MKVPVIWTGVVEPPSFMEVAVTTLRCEALLRHRMARSFTDWAPIKAVGAIASAERIIWRP